MDFDNLDFRFCDYLLISKSTWRGGKWIVIDSLPVTIGIWREGR